MYAMLGKTPLLCGLHRGSQCTRRAWGVERSPPEEVVDLYIDNEHNNSNLVFNAHSDCRGRAGC